MENVIMVYSDILISYALGLLGINEDEAVRNAYDKISDEVVNALNAQKLAVGDSCIKTIKLEDKKIKLKFLYKKNLAETGFAVQGSMQLINKTKDCLCVIVQLADTIMLNNELPMRFTGIVQPIADLKITHVKN